MKEISEKVKTLNGELSKAEEDLNNYMLTLPNIPNPTIPKTEKILYIIILLPNKIFIILSIQ